MESPHFVEKKLLYESLLQRISKLTDSQWHNYFTADTGKHGSYWSSIFDPKHGQKLLWLGDVNINDEGIVHADFMGNLYGDNTKEIHEFDKRFRLADPDLVDDLVDLIQKWKSIVILEDSVEVVSEHMTGRHGNPMRHRARRV